MRSFLDLSHTLSMYPNVVSLHLDADLGDTNKKGEYDENFALTFSHKLRDGCTTVKHYGLEIAKVAALPKDMLMWAKEAADRLNHLEESRKKSAPGIKVSRFMSFPKSIVCLLTLALSDCQQAQDIA